MSRKRTLQNPLLYSNFLKAVKKADPDFDTEIIDRTLEPDEAANILKKKYGVNLHKEEFNPTKEYRNNLYEMGIKHPRMQNFVMRQMTTPSQDALDMLAYVMGNRPEKNIKRDIGRNAKRAKTVRQYAGSPNRFDVVGVDTPGSKYFEGWF